ncbi:MAG: DUF3516 domain-containing protein [Actinomycetaceae bacterium]|nr:DUF3516 domain-containing protein [Actinomycetaceae bacterium]MDY6082925.1 DUF3516 domain-containing protein [Actinomycetaceae bacterium]
MSDEKSTVHSTPATQMPQPALNLALDRLEDAFGLNPDPDSIAREFEQWAESTGRPLYPHQEEALLGALDGAHLIVSTPTGSGKSMVALAAIFTALAHGKTAFYTAPLKALVSEKFFDLIRVFGADNVGMITGDSTINADAPVVCATAEIVANMALRQGSDTPIDVLVADEFHYYSDPQRGWAWQVPLLQMKKTQHILMSATLGDTSFIAHDLEQRTGRETLTIADAPRPVPLTYEWSLTPLSELVKQLVTNQKTPAYIVHFSQKEAVKQAQAMLGLPLVTAQQKKAIADALGHFRFGAGFGKILSKLLRSGIGVHHAGLLPRYRRLVERLAQAGLLQVICGTDTLGVGINVPIRTVVLTSLTKFDGAKSRHMSAREFHQIAGRAGRAGFDTEGTVIVQAPEYAIENAKAQAREASASFVNGKQVKSGKKIVKKKPPENTVLWSEKTFEHLVHAQPETLQSQMRITHAMILNVLQRPGDAVSAVADLVTHNHEPHSDSNPLIRRSVDIYSSLHSAGVITHHDVTWQRTHPGESAVSFARDVPDDFALNSPLAPFALAALDLLDRESSSYPLDVISVIEAVQEDPTPVLYAQEHAAKNEAITALKLAGVPYEQRMAEADSVSWPKPLQDLLVDALHTYSQTNPWVDDKDLSPKSVVRQMIEEGMTFTSLISRYDLARSEGVVLRYLTDVYKALRQTVPIQARTAELDQMTEWLGSMVRSVDSSLVDEWEALREGKVLPIDGSGMSLLSTEMTEDDEGSETQLAFGADADGYLAYTANLYQLRRQIRTTAFRYVEALEREDWDWLDTHSALGSWPGAHLWDSAAWDTATADYFDDYDDIGIDTSSRSAAFFDLNEEPQVADLVTAGIDATAAADLLDAHDPGRLWLFHQIFDDGVGDNDWGFFALIDLDASDQRDTLDFQIVSVGSMPGQ